LETIFSQEIRVIDCFSFGNKMHWNLGMCFENNITKLLQML
jgi:hypothetical protein